MLKKTITYKDLDGNSRTEDFYFNLTKAECVEMQLSKGGEEGLSGYLNEIVKSNDGALIIENFKEIIKKAYGKRSEDGRHFIKNAQLTEEFMGTEAYSDLFMELVTDAEASAKFIEGIVPADLKESVKNIQDTPPLSDQDFRPKKDYKSMSPAELASLPPEELQEALRSGALNLG
jgi:hypothetical protein